MIPSIRLILTNIRKIFKSVKLKLELVSLKFAWRFSSPAFWVVGCNPSQCQNALVQANCEKCHLNTLRWSEITCCLTSLKGEVKCLKRTGTAPSERTSFLKKIWLGWSKESSGVDAILGPGITYVKILDVNSFEEPKKKRKRERLRCEEQILCSS